MFGYVKPCPAQLRVWESDYFKAVYCGLCRALSKRYGRLSSNLLQYDFVFLALLLGEHEVPQKRKRCPAHPFRGRPAAAGSAALDAAADATVLMAYHKLGDNIRDGGFFRAAASRLALPWIKPKYRHAAARLPGTEKAAQEGLAELVRLERLSSASLDAPADTFARILSAMAETAAEHERRQVANLLYHLGRWIFLIDAADDLRGDLVRGAYNPLAQRFGLAAGAMGPGEKAELKGTLAFSRSSALLALRLLDGNKNTGILENILTLGLAAVEGRTFRAKEKKR